MSLSEYGSVCQGISGDRSVSMGRRGYGSITIGRSRDKSGIMGMSRSIQIDMNTDRNV